MSVYKKGRIWHYDFQHKGRRFYGSTGQQTKRAAETVERKKRLEAATGTYSNSIEMTITDAANRYWNEFASTKRSAADIRRRLEIMLTCVGPNRLLIEIDANVVLDALRDRRAIDLGRGAPSDTTVNRDIIDTTLRPILNKARKTWKVRNLHEIDWVELRAIEPEPDHIEYTDEEIRAWKAELDPVRRFALHLFLTYGFRKSEIEKLSPEAVDGVGRRIIIQGRYRKRPRPLIIPLLTEDARIISAMASRAKAAGLRYVFHHGDPPRNYASDTIGRSLREAAKRAGITNDRVVHGARHHAGTQMLRRTDNLRLAQKLLGHASIQSTVRYAHASEDDLRDALNKVSRNSPEAPQNNPDKSLESKGNNKG